jgi:MFS family permease
MAGRLSARVPARVLLCVGLLLVGGGLASMTVIDASSRWTAILPGLIVVGAGMGLTQAPLASASVAIVPPAQAGMASGINSTFRQVGLATGIAALGAIFASKVDPRAFAPHPGIAARASFVAGLHDILIVGAIVAACGAVLAAALVRRRDFVASGPQPA